MNPNPALTAFDTRPLGIAIATQDEKYYGWSTGAWDAPPFVAASHIKTMTAFRDPLTNRTQVLELPGGALIAGNNPTVLVFDLTDPKAPAQVDVDGGFQFAAGANPTRATFSIVARA